MSLRIGTAWGMIHPRTQARLEGALRSFPSVRPGATINVSLQALGDVAGGYLDSLKIAEARIDAAFGNEEGLSIFNAVNMMGYTNHPLNIGMARGVWSGAVDARFEEMGENEYGRYNHNNPDEVVFSSDLLGGGAEGAAKLATVMAHEGTHLFGNRVEGFAHMQGMETYGALMAIFGLAGDETFAGSMLTALADPRSWTENTGDVDHWFVRLDGSIEDDGSGDIRFEDGRATIKTGLGRQTGMNAWLQNGDSSWNAFTALMKGAGYSDDASEWSKMKGTVISKEAIDQAFKDGRLTADQYLQIHGYNDQAGRFVMSVQMARVRAAELKERQDLAYLDSITVPDEYVKLKDIDGFMPEMINPEIVSKTGGYYPTLKGKPVQDGEVADTTYCNVRLRDGTRDKLGSIIFRQMFGAKENPYQKLPSWGGAAMYDMFESNPNMVPLLPAQFDSMEKIQAKIDDGYFIVGTSKAVPDALKALTAPKILGHLAWGVPDSMSLFAFPDPMFNGKKYVDPPSGANAGYQQPFMGMAGSYGGVLPFDYAFGSLYKEAFTEDYYNSGYYDEKTGYTYFMRFYFVKRGR